VSQRIDKIFAETVKNDLSSWEKYEFLPNIRDNRRLTPSQERILGTIEARLARENAREDEDFDEDY
jgi:hypothetical protein